MISLVTERAQVMVLRSVTRRAFKLWRAPSPGKFVCSQVRSIIHGCSIAMRQRSTYRALCSWLGWRHDLLAARTRMEGTLKEWCSRGLRRGWFRWYEIYCARRQLKRFMAAMRMQLERQALTTWCSWRAEHDYMKHILLSLRPVGQSLRRALNTWRGLQRKRALNKLKRYMAAMRMQLERQALTTWCSWRAEHDYMKHILLSLRPVGQSLRRALNTWRTLRRKAVRLAMCVYSALRGLKRRGFNTWLTQVSRSALQKGHRGLSLLAARLLNRQLCRAWNQWMDSSQWPTIAYKLAGAFDRVQLRRALGTWRVESRRWHDHHFMQMQGLWEQAAAVDRGVLGVELLFLEAAASRYMIPGMTAGIALASAA